MKICLIHGKRIPREVVVRALSSGLGAEVVGFSSCESALTASLMDYNVFVVYNNFQRKMSGIQGAKRIRALNPDALIIGVSANPNFYRRFLESGADVAVLKAGNEVDELRAIIHQKVPEEQPQSGRPVVRPVRLIDVGRTSEVNPSSALPRIIEKIDAL